MTAADDLTTWRALADLDHAIGTLADLLDALDRLMTSDLSVPRLRRELAGLAQRAEALHEASKRLPAGATWAQVRGSALDDLRRAAYLDQPATFTNLLGTTTGPYPERHHQ